jgi:hypothetical protein
MKPTAFVLLCVLGANTTAAEDEYPHGLPTPIQHFVERKIDCDHWLGEYPFDAERRAAIDRTLKNLRCDTLSRDKAVLERRYRHDLSALKQLNDWAGDVPENSN